MRPSRVLPSPMVYEAKRVQEACGNALPKARMQSFCTYNIGGTSLSVVRFEKFLSALPRDESGAPPMFVSLSEYRPDSTGERFYLAAARRFGYHLLASPGTPKGGVALLVHVDIAGQKPPPMTEHLPARAISVELHLHSCMALPPTRIVAVYAPNFQNQRGPLERALQPLMQHSCVVMGDFNGTTSATDYTTSGSNHWEWLAERERHKQLWDLYKQLTPSPPHTRVRRYQGTSRIDKVYVTSPAIRLFQVTQMATYTITHTPDTHAQCSPGCTGHLSDHDMVVAYMDPWVTATEPVAGCSSWSRKQVKLFQRIVSDHMDGLGLGPHVRDADSLGQDALLEVHDTIMRAIPEAVIATNGERPPATRRKQTAWEGMVGGMARLARRNPKIFFRRVKQDLFSPLFQPMLPPPELGIADLMRVGSPWDPTVVSQLPQKDMSPPINAAIADDELRVKARVPRGKSAGPDKVPPYALYVLPEPLFHVVGNVIRMSLSLGELPPSLCPSSTRALYKGSGDWRLGKRWRPISMTQAVYRVLMRVVRDYVVPVVERVLSPTQFGSRKGRSTAMATLLLQEQVSTLLSQRVSGYVAMLDITNAFSSVPFGLLSAALNRVGVHKCVISLIESSLYHASFDVKQGSGASYQPLSGVKQGCPVAAVCFLLVYQILLCVLEQHGVPHTAFVDDAALVAATQVQVEQFVRLARDTLVRMGLDINDKTQIVGVHRPECPPPPEFSIELPLTPPRPRGWVCVDLQSPPGAYNVNVHEGNSAGGSMCLSSASPRVFTHLGHIVPCDMQAPTAYSEFLAECESSLTVIHNQPLTYKLRIIAINKMLMPKFIYQVEALPPCDRFLSRLQEMVYATVLGVTGLLPRASKKTLHTLSPKGMGLAHFPTAIPCRVLDVLSRYRVHFPWPIEDHHLLFPKRSFLHACTSLQADTLANKPLTQTTLTLPTHAGIPGAMEWDEVMQFYYLRAEHSADIPPLSNYTDGSFRHDPDACGAAAVMPSGVVYLAKPPGCPGIYKAELVALYLAAKHSEEGATLLTDSKSAMQRILSDQVVVYEARWVEAIRALIRLKGLVLEHVPAHTGILGNEEADKWAKVSSQKLQPQPYVHPKGPWEVGFKGELVSGPAKTWGRHQVPKHRHLHVHAWSWRKLSVSQRWDKWMFGHVSAPGLQHPQSFWFNSPPKLPCPTCKRMHNQSAHGYLAFCTPQHPLVTAWLSAWGSHAEQVKRWRLTAQVADLMVSGRLLLPETLVTALVQLRGKREARRVVRKYQNAVLPLVDAALPSFSAPPPSARKNPWDQSHWGKPTPLPLKPLPRNALGACGGSAVALRQASLRQLWS